MGRGVLFLIDNFMPSSIEDSSNPISSTRKDINFLFGSLIIVYYLIAEKIKDLVIWFKTILLIKINLFKRRNDIFLKGIKMIKLFAKNLIKESVKTIVETISKDLLK